MVGHSTPISGLNGPRFQFELTNGHAPPASNLVLPKHSEDQAEELAEIRIDSNPKFCRFNFAFQTVGSNIKAELLVGMEGPEFI